MDNQQHSRKLKTGSIPAPRPCTRCHGTGVFQYGNTATWLDHWISGQGFTEGICNVCWGSGDEEYPGPDLKEMSKRK